MFMWGLLLINSIGLPFFVDSLIIIKANEVAATYNDMISFDIITIFYKIYALIENQIRYQEEERLIDY